MAAGNVSAQTTQPHRDRAVYIVEYDQYQEDLLRQTQPDRKEWPEHKPVLRVDLTGVDVPDSPEDFKQMWHNKPICQDLTGACWAFAATSMLESEIERLLHRQVKLSEMHTVYWEWVEKARGFVREKGNSTFARGSEPNAVLRIWKEYGVVPAESYRGLTQGAKIYDDTGIFAEMRKYLETVRQKKDWNEKRVVAKIRSILDRTMGAPPVTFEADGKRMTPIEYARRSGINTDEYVCIVSMTTEPYDRWCEYPYEDNWWHSRDYYNVKLDDFVRLVREASQQGVSVCLGIDNSEPGFCCHQDVAIIPSFDVPVDSIDEHARQFRMSNRTTYDDHLVHLVGWQQRNGQCWYLIKDSDTTAHNGRHGGYMFYREDYIRLKTLMLMLPRAVAAKTLGRVLY